ncbi:hypothetical protein A4X06_0g8619 [Tilletia controversa]|uniref:Uncharacterized protein n=1 Tax=Tilletia controversa TaxID=13291 RepID=A0A8X7ST37_9BASI|nr:hypothetical protein A4X06_0g8619 [Tilletia controversa]
MTSLPTPSTSGDDHNPKPFKRDRKSDDITAADNAIQNVPGQENCVSYHSHGRMTVDGDCIVSATSEHSTPICSPRSRLLNCNRSWTWRRCRCRQVLVSRAASALASALAAVSPVVAESEPRSMAQVVALPIAVSIGIDADVEAEVNFIKKLYLVLYVKSRICLAINLPVSLWGFNITAPLGPSPPHLQDQSHPR